MDSLDLPCPGLDWTLDWTGLDWTGLWTGPWISVFSLYPACCFCCFLSFLVLVDCSGEPVSSVGNLLAQWGTCRLSGEPVGLVGSLLAILPCLLFCSLVGTT